MRLLAEEGHRRRRLDARGAALRAGGGRRRPSDSVVHGNNKSDEELRAAAEADAWLVVMDEPGEVERCAAAGVERVLIRVTPGIEAGGARGDPDRPRRARSSACPGGGARDDRRARARRGSRCSASTSTSARSSSRRSPRGRRSRGWRSSRAEARESIGWAPQVVNIGGGLGIRYVLEEPAPPDPETYARSLPTGSPTRGRCKSCPQPLVVLEPGRSLVGRAAVTLYRVGVVKRSGATHWVAVDGGMSDNPRPALYGARYSALLANRADEPPGRRRRRVRQALRVAATC